MKRLLYLIIAICTFAPIGTGAQIAASNPTDAEEYAVEAVDSVWIAEDTVEVIEVIDNSMKIAQVFAALPTDMLPLLSVGTRLDMVDYYANGLPTRSTNNLDGPSIINTMTSNQLNAEVSEASAIQLTLLPGSGKHDIAALVTTYSLNPSLDSKVEFMTIRTDTAETVSLDPLDARKLFSEPTFDQWLTPQGRKNRAEVVRLIPFLPVQYSVNPADNSLTAMLRLDGLVSDTDLETLAPLLQPSLTYKWNGKKYSLKK